MELKEELEEKVEKVPGLKEYLDHSIKKHGGLKEYLDHISPYYNLGPKECLNKISADYILKQKFKEAQKVPGLKEYLDHISEYYGNCSSIDELINTDTADILSMDLQIDIKGRAAAYVIEEEKTDYKKTDSGSNKIREFRVGAYGAFREGIGINFREGIGNDCTLLYHNMFESAAGPIKIKTLNITPSNVTVVVTSGEKEKYFKFDLHYSWACWHYLEDPRLNRCRTLTAEKTHILVRKHT